MKMLTSKEDFDKAKSRDLIQLECVICKKLIKRSKHNVQSHLKFIEEGRLLSGSFCSNKCQGKHNTKIQKVNCKQCNVEFLKHPCEIKKTTNNFCSYSCSGIYNSTHKNHGIRRARLEAWLESQLNILYPNLEIKYNYILPNRCELDIYIPSLSLAFELNGIFHYEPIFGEEKLEQTKERDKRKFKHCFDCNIGLCVIDTSKQKRFTPKSSQEFLDIIVNIINLKLNDNTKN